MSNDANCFALSEAQDGAGAGARVVFGVILGTGVGAGIVVDGQVLDGCNAIAGEWGHNPLPWPRDDERPGDACYCGRRGCIETWVSGPAFERDHLRHAGRDVPTAQIVADAAAGDAAASASLARYEERLARSLAHVINLLDPDVIVLGGGMSNVERLVRPRCRSCGVRGYSPTGSTRVSCATCTATRAACAAPRDYGRWLHRRVVRPAAAFGRDPVDVLPRVLDVAGLAVHAVLRVDLQPLACRASSRDELVDARRAVARFRPVVFARD